MQNKTQEYLEEMTRFPAYTPSTQELSAIQKAGIVPYLERHLLSNKFRKSKVDKELRDVILKKVRKSVQSNSPIHLTIPTGGYKKWQLESAPRVNWAEFFHLRYMLEYVAPIVAVYEPGVKLDYFSNAWLIKIISHYPEEDLQTYTESFRDLIEAFEKNFPDNLEIRYNVVAEQKDEKVLLERILKNRVLVEKEWAELDEEKKRVSLAGSERNIRWDILEKDSRLSKKEREKLIYEGRIVHDCLLRGGWNSDLYYLRSENGIGIIHRNNAKGFIHLATISGAFVQFWVGVGVLEQRGDKLVPRVLSAKQYGEVQNRLKKMNIAVEGFELEEIEVLKG